MHRGRIGRFDWLLYPGSPENKIGKKIGKIGLKTETLKLMMMMMAKKSRNRFEGSPGADQLNNEYQEVCLLEIKNEIDLVTSKVDES